MYKRNMLETLKKERSLASHGTALSSHGYKCFSQNEEDGIIEEL